MVEWLLQGLLARGAVVFPFLVLGLVGAMLLVGRHDRFFLPRRWWRILLDLVLAAVLGVVLFAAYFVSTVHTALVARTSRLEFVLLDDGSMHRLDDYRGKVVVLNYWATWCDPCREEMPELNRFATEYAPRGVVVITVTDETPAEVSRYESTAGPLRSVRATFDSEAESRPSGAIAAVAYQGRPTTIVLDRDGAVRELLIGPQSHDAFVHAVERHL
jgi:thiol-disulfide isomerase/thioredoxin